MPKPIIDELFLKSRCTIDENGCWVYANIVSKKDRLQSYGRIQYRDEFGKKQTMIASRVSYEFFNGTIGEGLFICHKCDNPSCINPDHLFHGTPMDNTIDMINKGRWSKIGLNKGGVFNNKVVEINGKEFMSLTEAGKYLGISGNGVKKRILRNADGYKYK